MGLFRRKRTEEGVTDRSPAPSSASIGLLSAASPRNQKPYLDSMGSVGTLFSIINRTSTSTAACEWKLYRKSTTGRREDRVEVTKHLALDVWNRPNPFYTRQEFVEAQQQHIDLTGEGWWAVAFLPGTRIPSELWPMRPDRVTVVESPSEFIAGYVYTTPSGTQVPLARDEVIQIRMPNPSDPYRGMGPVQAILADLDAARYSAVWNRNFFLNSAEPGGIIEIDKTLSDNEWRNLRLRWNEQHKGVANAHRVAILEQGKWVDRAYSMRDMQFTELRSVAREIIREAYAVTKFDLGSMDDVNRAAASASDARWAKHLIVPRLERFKRALNADFLPLFGPTGKGVEFDYVSPVSSDSEADNAERDSKVNALVALLGAGVDPADACSIVGLPNISVTKLEPAPSNQVDTVAPSNLYALLNRAENARGQ